jgi:hypothetical protein
LITPSVSTSSRGSVATAEGAMLSWPGKWLAAYETPKGCQRTPPTLLRRPAWFSSAAALPLVHTVTPRAKRTERPNVYTVKGGKQTTPIASLLAGIDGLHNRLLVHILPAAGETGRARQLRAGMSFAYPGVPRNPSRRLTRYTSGLCPSLRAHRSKRQTTTSPW